MQLAAKINGVGRFFIRTVSALMLIALVAAGTVLVHLFRDAAQTFDSELSQATNHTASKIPPFPVGVDPIHKTILENQSAENYLELHFASEYDRTHKITWFDGLYRHLSELPLYQSLASPSSRILVIYPGERKEEITMKFSKILGWKKDDRSTFMELVSNSPLEISDGTFFPGKYVVAANASPEAVAKQIQTSFSQKVQQRYTDEVAAAVPIEEALIIASLIEREASSFTDMREVSGVIWRRLFDDMRLQLDASLQYARGSLSYEPEWWPVPTSRDKFIDSAYNTYLHDGLPPGPIGNPSAAAIIAALNPVDSDCLFYFHYRRDLYCSTTYEEHVEKLRQIYGTGR